MQGQLLADRYRLVDTLGSGGMGRVWRARDEILHREVAIKELTAALYVTESERVRLFARTDAEARAAARINHAAVVTVHDVLDHDNRPWIVMELVEGASLADAVKERGRVESREAARIGLWVLRALRAAHEAGVLHRDVKPGNVLLAEDGRVLLTDFGIAQVEGDTTITKTGEIVGSVDYIAPERVRGHDPGPASDLWALGATLYTAVEGRSPFRRTTPLVTMQAVVEEEPAEPEHAGPLGPVITALLRKDPANRPGAAEAEHMLAEAAEGRQPRVARAYMPTRHAGIRPRVHADAPLDTPLDAALHGPGTPGAPYPPVTGVTTTAPEHRPPTAAAPSRRRRLRTLALVVAFAAIVGGGTAVVLQQWDGERQQDGNLSVSPSATKPTPTKRTPPKPTPTKTSKRSPGPEDSVPDNWVTVTDPEGFGLSLPKGWKRQLFSDQGDLKQIDYTPDGGKHLLRIAIDRAPDFNDPYAHQLDLEEQLREQLVDYDRVTLRVDTYRDRRASLWDYTWTAPARDPDRPGPNRERAIVETYIARDGVEYALYMSGPVEDWATTRKRFDMVLRCWKPQSGQPQSWKPQSGMTIPTRSEVRPHVR